VRELVLDASVVLKWFAPGAEPGATEAGRLRSHYEDGRLAVVVPSLIFREILNVAGRRWAWEEEELAELAAALDDLGFDITEPELSSVAAWVARGLTAYDAAYVALAEQSAIELVSDDTEVLTVGAEVARPLVPSA
jgi:predicted nucleic acid-binding protein